MLPRQYRHRYLVIFVLSLLVHLVVLTVLMLNPLFEVEKHEGEKKVVIKLKTEKEPEKQVKKEETKKEEAKKQEPKKQEPKKQEPKKQEPKKQEPKKQEPKKQEPKKQEPKKQEPKKQEPKKQEPKKQELKKQEPKKQEPKKQEPKKQEPKKQEPKKEEPKKQEPKKQEPKKQEPKKQEPKKQEVTEIPDIYKDMMLEQPEPIQAPITPNKNSLPIPKLGSMQQLDAQQMSRAVVYTGSLSQNDAARAVQGVRMRKGLSEKNRSILDRAHQIAGDAILKNAKSVKWDGGKYRGEIIFFVDHTGRIEKIYLRKPSGHEQLDQSWIDAIKKTYRLPLPNNRKAREVFIVTRKLFYYDETDMIR